MSAWKQKLAAGVSAALLAMGMLPAAAMGLTADTTITVTNIDEGDTAAYYQVVQQNSSTKAWELTTAFAGLDLTKTTANAAENARRAAADPVETAGTTLDFILDGIDADEAALIAAAAGTKTGDLTGSGTTYTATVDPGMYLVLVTPANGNKDVVYKPIIVSADYDQSDESPNSVDATTSLPTPTTAAAKKSPLTLTKTSAEAKGNASKQDGATSVAVGDTVDFTVTSNIPTYTGNFTSPVYKITDVLSDGLTMTDEQQAGITVTVAGYGSLAKGTDYTVTATASGYTVTFLNDDPTVDGAKDGFLYTVTGNPQVTITYSATVTSDAAQQVNEMDNTVTLNFSNTPSDTSGAGELTDKTRHYTFDIDGNVFGGGGDGGKTKEVEKVGVDGNGNVIESITYTDYPEKLPTGESPLANAKFQLRTTAADESTALYFDANGKRCASDADGAQNYVLSGSDGSITMKGLDEGTYFLVETEAPAGYSFDPDPKTVVIAATYVDDADGNKVLSSYTITIGGNASTYTAKLDADNKPIELTDDEAALTAGTDNTTTLIINKKLGILPSTGGSGIYFYIIVGGAIAGGAAYLIRKTRKEEQQLA